MGVVWRATQLALDRPVALKAMAPELAADAQFRERFQREAHLAASIEHPNVIPVYEAGELDGTLYLIMRWVDGTDLRGLLSESGRLAPARALRLLRPVALALAAAHRRGLIHRDIKPANVLIARGEEEHVYLTDFGIARLESGEGGMTRTGVLVGTLDYTAPERFEGARGDAASDIYAFGCMLYQTLTGSVPYDRPTDVSKMFAHISDPVPAARDAVPGVPGSVDAIIARAMAKRPEDRFRSAAELAEALATSLQALATTEVPTRVVAPTTKPLAAPTVPSPPAAPTVAEPATAATAPEPRQRTERDQRLPPAKTVVAAPKGGGGRVAAVALAAVVLVGAIVAAVIAASGGGGSKHAATTAAPPAGEVTAHTGVGVGSYTSIPGRPGTISAGDRYIWTTLPDSGKLFRLEQANGNVLTFAVGGHPTGIASALADRGVWVAGSSFGPLALLRWQDAALRARTAIAQTPTTATVDPNDGTAWAVDPTGGVNHVGLDGTLIRTAQVPGAKAVAVGEGWTWVVDGGHLFRIGAGSPTPYPGGPSPVSVTVDSGIWTVSAGGVITRFNPATLKPSATARIGAPELDQIAAVDGKPSVWAISRTTKRLYRIDAHGQPRVIGSVDFASAPVALAVSSQNVWVATADGQLVELQG
jgi:serine/threonine-protein kinase